jgi:hypothetical protein
MRCLRLPVQDNSSRTTCLRQASRFDADHSTRPSWLPLRPDEDNPCSRQKTWTERLTMTITNENENKPSTKRSIPLASLAPVLPGGNGQIAFKMAGSAELHGLEVESGARATRLTAAKLRIDLKDDTLSPEEMLAKAMTDNGGPIRISGYVTILVKNEGTEARTIRAALLVDKEEAPEAKAAPPLDPKTQRVTSRETISGGNSSGAQRARAVRTNAVPKIQHRLPTVRPSPAKQVSGRVNGKGMVPAVRHATQPALEMVLPEVGQHAVLMLRGHVFGLVRFLTSRVPLHPSFVPTVSRQLVQGMARQGAVSVGGNEVAVLLTPVQIARLGAVVGQRFNHLPQAETDALVAALNKAFEPSSSPQVDGDHLLEATTAAAE